MSWKADTSVITADSTRATADGYLPGWTADATHFTVDDNTNHTADGWHDDTAVAQVGLGGGGSNVQRRNAVGQQQEERHLRLIKQDDELIMMVIEEFLQKAA